MNHIFAYSSIKQSEFSIQRILQRCCRKLICLLRISVRAPFLTFHLVLDSLSGLLIPGFYARKGIGTRRFIRLGGFQSDIHIIDKNGLLHA